MKNVEENKKMRWEDVYKEFRKTHPTFSKNIIDWKPHNYGTILLYLKDGSKMIYDCITKYCKFI